MLAEGAATYFLSAVRAEQYPTVAEQELWHESFWGNHKAHD